LIEERKGAARREGTTQDRDVRALFAASIAEFGKSIPEYGFCTQICLYRPNISQRDRLAITAETPKSADDLLVVMDVLAGDRAGYRISPEFLDVTN
jgi:hypothetical protein